MKKNNAPLNHVDNLALSYDNTAILDGAGSQLHRIYSIYAISRFLGVSYIHSPLQEIPYQGLLSLEKNELNPELITRYNQLFTIPSDREIPKDAQIYYLVKQDLEWLHTFKEAVSQSRGFFLLNISLPFHLAEKHPEMFHYVKEVSPFDAVTSSVFKIAIHVRRGDLLISPEGNRMLPNSYYITLALQIVEALKTLHIPFICELHTEIPTKTFMVTSAHHGMKEMKNRVETPVTLSPENNSLKDFDVIPNLKKCINHDPIETLRSFATADLFIMSRSSFSYLPAMLNKKGIIVYHPFWHAAPLEWLDATHEKSFYERLVEACKKWKINHKEHKKEL